MSARTQEATEMFSNLDKTQRPQCVSCVHARWFGCGLDFLGLLSDWGKRMGVPIGEFGNINISFISISEGHQVEAGGLLKDSQGLCISKGLAYGTVARAFRLSLGQEACSFPSVVNKPLALISRTKTTPGMANCLFCSTVVFVTPPTTISQKPFIPVLTWAIAL